MKYMLLIYFNEKVLGAPEREACYEESLCLASDLHAKGQFLGASPLHPVATATAVRIRDGKRTITDGPFAETHEQLGGYYMVDVPNLDEAIAVASRIPGARYGTVEVRPVIELEGIPDTNQGDGQQ